MKLFAYLLLFFGCTIANAAATPDQIAAYRALVQQDLRLAVVSYRLAYSNAPYCTRSERNPGLVLHDEAQYPNRDIARTAFRFPVPVAIAAVVPGGPADKAGIETGDGLIAINNQAVIAVSDAAEKQSAERVEKIYANIRNALRKNGSVKLTFETEAGPKTVMLEPPAICASRFWVDARSGIDAGADGDGVRVTEGMMAFTSSDDAQLAALVAHELSHNLLGHRERLNAGKGRTKDILATEIEADRLSVWLMANAGYDTAAALRFAERFGRKTSWGILSAGTHLRWKNRVKLMQSEIALIEQAERKNGLIPPPLLVGSE